MAKYQAFEKRSRIYESIWPAFNGVQHRFIVSESDSHYGNR